MYKIDFIRAIQNKRKVCVTYFSKKEQKSITRICAPMDFGPSGKDPGKMDRYHMWDFKDGRGHTVSLLPEQIEKMEFLEAPFEPEDFVTWSPDWIIARNW